MDIIDDWYHYGDVIISEMESPASWSCAQSFVQAQIKENIKTPRHWPLWRGSIGDQWIPLTKSQGVVSLTFRELSKKISRNLCITQIVLLMRISSWNFVRVPCFWHTYNFSDWNSHHKCDFWCCLFFARIFWGARETLVKLPPVTRKMFPFDDVIMFGWWMFF